MFGSANRDSEVFDEPDVFDIDRNNNLSIPFGAGPHYCAGAWISRTLIADVALPKLFTRLKNLSLSPTYTYDFDGWAFRGLTSLECQWDKT